MTRRDPIVEEVRKHRAAIAREHGNDIEAILAALEREPDDTPTVSLPPRRLGTRVRQRRLRPRRRPKRMERTARQRQCRAATGQVQLRAYPSSGALYAVEIYPVVFRVEGLEPAVYHYRAPEHVLELVRAGIDPAMFVHAALPVEREMVAGAAALICLTGCFSRHERKYGEGGYRMLVAEAGHISQNLILAATALGLSARPFGGVFDDLLNRDLGIDPDEEQFLLAVLLGLV